MPRNELNAIEFNTFYSLAIYLVTLKRADEDVKDIPRGEIYEEISELTGWKADTVRNKISKGNVILKKDNFSHFCSEFFKLCESDNDEKRRKSQYLQFFMWVRDICQSRNWANPLQNQPHFNFYSRLIYDAGIDKTSKDFEEIHLAITKIFSDENGEGAHHQWKLLSNKIKQEKYFGDLSHYNKFFRPSTRHPVPLNFIRRSEDLIECHVFYELAVWNATIYAVYLEDLFQFGLNLEYDKHLKSTIEAFNVMHQKYIAAGLQKQVDEWFIHLEDGKKAIALSTIFDILNIDIVNIHRILPLTKNAYIKTYAFCKFILEDNEWRLLDLIPRRYNSAHSNLNPDLYIPVGTKLL